MPITRFFRLSHVTLARLAVEEYVRLFWWFFAPIPIFGVWALMAAWSTQLQVIGAFAALWPITLPTRAYFATRKAGRLYQAGVTIGTDADALYLVPEEGTGLRIAYDSVRSMGHRHGYIVIRLRSLGFFVIPDDVFLSDDKKHAFEARFKR